MIGSTTTPEKVISLIMAEMSRPSPKKNQVTASPSPTPMKPLAAVRVRPSISTMVPVCPGVSPSARSTANSRRRCNTDISTVLTTPNAMIVKMNACTR